MELVPWQWWWNSRKGMVGSDIGESIDLIFQSIAS